MSVLQSSSEGWVGEEYGGFKEALTTLGSWDGGWEGICSACQVSLPESSAGSAVWGVVRLVPGD